MLLPQVVEERLLLRVSAPAHQLGRGRRFPKVGAFGCRRRHLHLERLGPGLAFSLVSNVAWVRRQAGSRRFGAAIRLVRALPKVRTSPADRFLFFFRGDDEAAMRVRGGEDAALADAAVGEGGAGPVGDPAVAGTGWGDDAPAGLGPGGTNATPPAAAAAAVAAAATMNTATRTDGRRAMFAGVNRFVM